MTPTISVIIPNLNSILIDQTLTALSRQQFDLSKVEVLIVGLDDPGLVQSSSLVRFIPTAGPLSAACNRNIGIREARGQILCFTDADCVPAPDWLALLTAPFADSEVFVVGGGVIFEDHNYWARCDHLSWFYQFMTTAPAGERSHLPTLNLSVRRFVIDHVGLLDESYPFAAGEDTEWTMRMRGMGYRLLFDPHAVVKHIAARSSLGQMYRHSYQYGLSTPKVKCSKGLSFLESRLMPRQWWLLLLLSPLLSVAATARVVISQLRSKVLWGIWGIGLSKMAWCLGAAAALRRATQEKECR
jgi:GT2 family glycosyltransferase